MMDTMAVTLDVPDTVDMSHFPKEITLTRRSSLLLLIGVAEQLGVDLRKAGLEFSSLPFGQN